MSAVRRPVNVFCWLGWNVPRSMTRPTRTSAPWPNRGRGPGLAPPLASIARSPAAQPERASATITRALGSRGQLAVEVWRAAIRARPGGRVARRRTSGRPRHVGALQLQAVARPGRRGLVREPRRWSAAKRKSPDRSPVKDAARSIAAMRGRGEPDEHDPGPWRPPSRHGRAQYVRRGTAPAGLPRPPPAIPRAVGRRDTRRSRPRPRGEQRRHRGGVVAHGRSYRTPRSVSVSAAPTTAAPTTATPTSAAPKNATSTNASPPTTAAIALRAW